MGRLPPAIHWIGTFEKQTNKQTNRQGTLALFQLNIEMFLKATQLVGRDL